MAIPEWLKDLPIQRFEDRFDNLSLVVMAGPSEAALQQGVSRASLQVSEQRRGPTGRPYQPASWGLLTLLGIISEPAVTGYTVIGMAAGRLHRIAAGDLLILPDYDPATQRGSLQLLNHQGGLWLWARYAASICPQT